MPTPIFISGAESNIAAAHTASGHIALWSAAPGATSISTATVHPGGGSRSFRCNASGTASYFEHTFHTAVASPSVVVGRFYLRLASFPSVSINVMQVRNGTTGLGGVRLTDGGMLISRALNSAGGSDGCQLELNRWYRVDFRVTSGATATGEMMVDGIEYGMASVASSAQQATNFRVGVLINATCEMFLDHLMVSGTSADYPIGHGAVVGLYPNRDGTHNYDSSADFRDEGATGANLNADPALETDVWQSLQNPLSDAKGSAYSRVFTSVTTEYVTVGFEPLPGWVQTVNGVGTHRIAGASSGNPCFAHFQMIYGWGGSAFVHNGQTQTTGVAGIYRALATPSGGWTPARVNDVYSRTSGGNDSSPVPEIHGFCLEVDCIPKKRSLHPLVHDHAVHRASRW